MASCKKCGEKIEEGMKFCPNCAAPAPKAPPAKAASKEKPPRTAGFVLHVLAAVLLLAAFSGVSFLILPPLGKQVFAILSAGITAVALIIALKQDHDAPLTGKDRVPGFYLYLAMAFILVLHGLLYIPLKSTILVVLWIAFGVAALVCALKANGAHKREDPSSSRMYRLVAVLICVIGLLVLCLAAPAALTRVQG